MLDQIPPNLHGAEPKLKGKLFFKTLSCVQSWSEKANKVLPGLQKEAAGLEPRGMLLDESVPGLYV